ncbi:hypothetical protein Tco_1289094 [Tanacetum coccineum]
MVLEGCFIFEIGTVGLSDPVVRPEVADMIDVHGEISGLPPHNSLFHRDAFGGGIFFVLLESHEVDNISTLRKVEGWTCLCGVVDTPAIPQAQSPPLDVNVGWCIGGLGGEMKFGEKLEFQVQTNQGTVNDQDHNV